MIYEQTEQQKGRCFAASDWHGCGKIANKIFDFLNPEDTLFFLGDAVDRGSDGVKILDALLKRPNTYFIKGNHEQFIEYCDISYPNTLWINTNGGLQTYSALSEDTEKFLYFQKRIKDMPLEIRYKSLKGHTVILEHSGYSPFTVHRKHDPCWDREHFMDCWAYVPQEETENTYLVHGHTPVQYLKLIYGYIDQSPLTKEDLEHKREWCSGDYCSFISTVIRYCDGHKFDIDLCTVASRRAVLLDLDTFEEIYFEE